MYTRRSSKVIFQHPRLLVEEDTVELPSGETIEYLLYGYGGDGVVVIARNDQDEILFLREYSYVPNRKLFQLPMGKIEQGETPEAAANREFQEETGFKAANFDLQGSYFQNHRRSDNKGFVLMATDLGRSELSSDREELDIEEIWVPAADISSLIGKGEIVDADTLSSLRICNL